MNRLCINSNFILLAALIIILRTITFSEELQEFNPADSVPVDTTIEDQVEEPLFSFRADNTEINNALCIFAKSNGMELKVAMKLIGSVNVSFEKKTLGESMDKLLAGKNAEWELKGNQLIVRATKAQTQTTLVEKINDTASLTPPAALSITDNGTSRLFEINYPRLKRTGQGSSTASVSSTSSGQAGSVQLTTGDEIMFWQELEEQLKLMVSSEGKLVINKMSGVIYIEDKTEQLDNIQKFIQAVVKAATRQVEITARLYEITLNKDNSIGVNWNNINASLTKKGHDGFLNAVSNVILHSPDYSAATLNFDASVDDKVQVIVEALKEQGNVKSISQPRVMTTNNQPALVKIGTDMPFFSATVTTNMETNTRDVQEEIRVVTVGVVLSVTPQISGDGWITLGIDPLISDLVGTRESKNGSTAPIIDVKQSSALVRLKDRQTVRISGLLQTKKNIKERKVPLLGDIPILGYMFKWKHTQETRKELVIFITPRVL